MIHFDWGKEKNGVAQAYRAADLFSSGAEEAGLSG